MLSGSDMVRYEINMEKTGGFTEDLGKTMQGSLRWRS
jgi:hypothetical protein